MKIALCADIHLHNHPRFVKGVTPEGINSRATLVLNALRRAHLLAISNRASAFFILGDLFDTVSPHPNLMREVMNTLFHDSIITYILAGNHDVLTKSGVSVLGVLGFAPGIEVIEKNPAVAGPVLSIPYVHGIRQILPDLVRGAIRGSEKPKVLLLHAGIETDETPAFLQGAQDAVHIDHLIAICKKHGIEAVFAGNWHKPWTRIEGGVRVTQCGTLCPAGFDDTEVEAYSWLYDIDAKRLEKIPVPGPRFCTVEASDLLDKPAVLKSIASVPAQGRMFYRFVGAKQADVPIIHAKIKSLARGHLVGQYEIILDKTEKRETALAAAQGARSAQTLDEAITRFVHSMDLAGVEAEEVISRARKYMSR